MKSFVVLGLGLFGKSLARTLFEMGHEVLAVDDDMDTINSIASHVTHAVQANVTDEEFLQSLDIKKFDGAIVAIGSSMQVSIMATVLLKELEAKYVMVKAQDEFEARILYKVGADKVILPETDMGMKAAHSLISDNVLDAIEISKDYSIVSIPVPDSWCGKTIGDLLIRSRYGVNIIVIRNPNGTIMMPQPDLQIKEGLVVTLMGGNANLKKVHALR